jgi:hypothetical protein
MWKSLRRCSESHLDSGPTDILKPGISRVTVEYIIDVEDSSNHFSREERARRGDLITETQRHEVVLSVLQSNGSAIRRVFGANASVTVTRANDSPRQYVYAVRPQQFLYFLPLPHGQGSFRPTLGLTLRTEGITSCSSSPLLSFWSAGDAVKASRPGKGPAGA